MGTRQWASTGTRSSARAVSASLRSRRPAFHALFEIAHEWYASSGVLHRA